MRSSGASAGDDALVQQPISKLDDDTFTRVRIILLNGLEHEALRFSHAFARMNRDMRAPLARVRRVEQHQHTMINWLIGADHSPLETTIAYEQVAIEITAAVAQAEPDPYLAQTYRFGLLEDKRREPDKVAAQEAAFLIRCTTHLCHAAPGNTSSMARRSPSRARGSWAPST